MTTPTYDAGYGSFDGIVRAVNGDTTRGHQVAEYPEDITYIVETLNRSAPLILSGVTPAGVRPSPDGVSQIFSARVGDPCKILDYDNELTVTLQEALYVKRCGE